MLNRQKSVSPTEPRSRGTRIPNAVNEHGGHHRDGDLRSITSSSIDSTNGHTNGGAHRTNGSTTDQVKYKFSNGTCYQL